MGKRQGVKPGVFYCSSGSLYATAGEAISKNEVLVCTGTTSGGRMTVALADDNTAADKLAVLFIAVHAAPSGGRIEIHPGPYVVTGVDTSGFTANKSIVALDGTPGAVTTDSAGARMVGSVGTKSATVGTWIFNGSILTIGLA